jgi:hypothetical protein
MIIKSPIDIPVGSSGELSIERLEDGTHRLISEKSGTWMTDLPIEVLQMNESVEDVNASGRGLVGGLGLGVVAEMLGAKDGVTSVDIVEISQDVVNLVKDHLPHKDKFNIIVKDIKEFLGDLTSWPYDFAILDTWKGQSAETWLIQVLPLRRLIANKFGAQNVNCWVEREMKVELLKILTTKKPYWMLSKLPMPMSEEDAIWFMDNVGSKDWEVIYGQCI